MTQVFKRWDVVKIPYPPRQRPALAHRPALVIVAGDLLKTHGLLWVLMITSAKNRGWPGDVPLADPVAAGLGVPAVIRTAKIMTIEGKDAEPIGALLGEQRHQVGQQVFTNMGLTVPLNPGA